MFSLKYISLYLQRTLLIQVIQKFQIFFFNNSILLGEQLNESSCTYKYSDNILNNITVQTTCLQEVLFSVFCKDRFLDL